jgi:glucokinase
MTVLALDVGGTKILAGAFADDGRLLVESQRPSRGSHGAEAVLAAMAAALADLGPVAGVSALGIACAGVIDPATARVVSATDAIPRWAGTDLGAHFGPTPVRALNDVQAALLGELAGQPAPGCTVMLTLGTGLGGAIAFDGRLHTGAHHLAGHFGRAPLRGEPVEGLLSGTGLARLYERLGGSAPDGARSVFAASDAGADTALSLWLDALAEQLTQLHWTLDPARVLIGGGLLAVSERWWPGLMRRLQVPLTVQPARLGTRAGLVGAAHWAREGQRG